MRSLMLATLASALCLVATSRASADLIVNGGFETGDFTGWSVTAENVDNFVTSNYPYAGSYSADLGSTVTNFGSLSQFVNTQAGVEYILSFYLNCYDDNIAGPTNFFDVFFDLNPVYSETDRPDDGAPYVYFSFIVVGNGSLQELRFDFGNDAGVFYIDNVSLVAVPVPAGFILFSIGALGVAGMQLRRRVLARKDQPV